MASENKRIARTESEQSSDTFNSAWVMELSGCSDLLDMVKDTSTPLRILEPPADEPLQLSSLFYNAMAIELRDMFRMLRGLDDRASRNALQMENITVFYEWFEGFFGILSCMFDSEEDVVFSWIEKIGAIQLEHGLGPSRRRAKKQRTKDLCWDLFDLKTHFDRKIERRTDMRDLVHELMDEAQQLATRIMTYLHSSKDNLPMVLEANFSFDERCMIEMSLMKTLRASEPGKLTICALSRGFVDVEQKNGFLEECLRAGKAAKATVPKQIRKFRKMHADIVDKLAIEKLLIENAC